MTKPKNKEKNMSQEYFPPVEVITPEIVGIERKNGGIDYSKLPVAEQMAYKCRDKIVNAVRSAEKAYTDIATGLYEAFTHESYYDVWGCNFSDFAEHTLGIGITHAYNLKDIGEFIANHPEIGVDRANQIGWTKMLEIVRAVKKNQALPIDHYVERAFDATVKDLKAELQAEIKRANGDDDESQEEASGSKDEEKADMKESKGKDATVASLKLALTYEADQAAFVREAIGYAANELNLDVSDKKTASKAIEHVCSTFLEMRSVTPVALTVYDWIKFIHDKYGVTLVESVEESDLGTVLGGYEAVQEEVSIEEQLDSDPDVLKSLGISSPKQ